MEIGEKYRKIKEKLQGIDNLLSMNWKHILGDNACVRRSSRGIKIEYRKKKEGNRRKDKEKELEVPLESFRIDE